MAMTDLGNLTGSGGTLFGTGANENAYSVSNLYKQVYTDLVRLQIQQFDSLLSDTLMNESIEGEVKSFDKYLKHDVSKLKTRSRFGQWGDGTDANAYGATDSERRLIEPQWFEYAELFDPRDEVGLLKAIAPDGMYLANIAAIFNQKKDQLILDALSKNVLVQTRTGAGVTANTTTAFGTAVSGALGGTGVATGEVAITAGGVMTLQAGYEGLEIGCKLAKAAGNSDTTPLVKFDTAGTSATAAVFVAGTAIDVTAAAPDLTPGATTGANAVTEFNIEKLIRARQKLDANNALMPGMPYICVLHPNQFYSLMADSDDQRFTSIDFNEGKPLFQGTAFVFMGFEFRLSNLLPQASITIPNGNGSLVDGKVTLDVANDDGNAVRYSYFYTPACGIFGMNAGMEVRFDEIPERGYSLQMWHQVGMNGLRMDGDCIVRVASVDNAA
ncbi:MAG: phage capsid protein [bacterium]